VTEQPETPQAADEAPAGHEPVAQPPVPEPESEPATAPLPPAAAPPPPPPPGPVSTQSTGFDPVAGGQEESLVVQRPEIAVGAAFAGGLVLAVLLKRLAR
jgi:hypothetical protein